MVASTYEHFTYLYDIPYTLIVIAYLLSKYIVLIEFICTYCNSRRSHSITCCGCWKKLARLWRQVTTWMVRIIFGGTEGVTEYRSTAKSHETLESQDQTDDDHTLESDETEDGVRKVFIRGTHVKGMDLDIIGVIILCFFLLLMLTMYSTYLLEVSFSCSEDPAHYCFPQLINSKAPDNPVIDENIRITNCSNWINPGVASKVTFRCFRYALNGKEALVVGGGLLAIFVVSMRTLISIIVNIYEHMNKHKFILQTLRITLLVILVCFNLASSLIIMVFTLADNLESLESEGAPVAQQVAAYIAENGVQLVIILGTMELLLLIDWERYQGDHQPKKKCGRGDKILVPSDNMELKEEDVVVEVA